MRCDTCMFICSYSLPKSVLRRVKALKKLQYQMLCMESKFYEEVHQLECKYAELYAPILEQVMLIIHWLLQVTVSLDVWAIEVVTS